MKTFTITLLLLCTWLITGVQAQQTYSSLTIGHKNTLYSKILNENREVWVHVPKSYNKQTSTQKYPVAYVLDGDQHFHGLSGLIHQLSATTGNTLCPEMIVVAIMNTDRTRDLTITHKTTGFGVDPQFAKNSGGGEKFTAFIEKELFPFINSHYPAAPYRTMIGHSLGGMLVVNTLLNHTEMFNAYIALDPSLWWDDLLLVKQAQQQLKENKFTNKAFYLAVANSIRSDKDTAEQRKDKNAYNLQLNSQLDFADLLRSNSENGLRWKYDYFKEEGHQSIPLIGQYHALKFIFNFHPFTSFEQLFDPALDADSALAAHYQNISTHLGYQVLPPEELMDGLGHAFLESALLDKAEGIFTLNLQNYPKSPGVYTALGDLYTKKGDNKLAITYYQKSLGLKKDPALQKKVSELTKRTQSSILQLSGS
jgi:predicted alpha/beta superfamily hydrolase